MHATISIYEDIAAATGAMREAALRADWDALVAAENVCASHIARARAAVVPAEQLDAESRAQKAQLIRRMLADDAEVRACVQPWMAQVESLLSGAATRDRAARAYRDMQGPAGRQ